MRVPRGSTRVPRGSSRAAGGAGPKRSTVCCWGYHLSLFFCSGVFDSIVKKLVYGANVGIFGRTPPQTCPAWRERSSKILHAMGKITWNWGAWRPVLEAEFRFHAFHRSAMRGLIRGVDSS